MTYNGLKKIVSLSRSPCLITLRLCLITFARASNSVQLRSFCISDGCCLFAGRYRERSSARLSWSNRRLLSLLVSVTWFIDVGLGGNCLSFDVYVNLFPHVIFFPINVSFSPIFYNKETLKAIEHFSRYPCFDSACTSVKKLLRHHGTTSECCALLMSTHKLAPWSGRSSDRSLREIQPGQPGVGDEHTCLSHFATC